MNRDVALHFLQDLVNVPVQHRNRTEALEVSKRLRAVIGTPAPLGINRPQRNVYKNKDGSAALQMLHVTFDPVKLFLPERPPSARLQVENIYQPHKVHALVIESRVAFSLRLATEPVQILFAGGGEYVVFAGNIEDFPDLCSPEHVSRRLKFGWLRPVRNIAGAHEEFRRRG